MAINTLVKTCDKIESKYSSNSPRGNLPPSHLLKLNKLADDSVSSSDGKSIKTKRIKNAKSPYLTNENVHMLSRVTEKKLVHKRATNMISSFPLAVNIYKANSDEFKSLKKGIKKVKKSVLTLPNVPATMPQTCTVSDMNDSEYLNTSDDNKKMKAKKRFLAQNRKARPRNKDYEFYDRDARYCSQMNIDLDCSSNEVIDQFTGDGKCVTNKYRSSNRSQADKEFSAHDVWAVLRNINRFQFRPSPPMSDDSIQMPKKKKIRNRRRNNRKDSRVIETCCTEEVAFISSFGVDCHTPTSFSKSSSIDRITVIDTQDEFNDMCKEFGKSFQKYDNTRQTTVNKDSIRKNTKKVAKTTTFKENSVHKIPNKVTMTDNIIGPCANTKNKSNTKIAAMTPQKNRNCVYRQENIKTCNGITEKHEEFYSDTIDQLHFRPSKDTLCSIGKKIKDNDNVHNVLSTESGQHMKGITKVVLSKGQEIPVSKRNDNIIQKRKVSTMPSTIMPKLTQADINRRLANMKFPIVILGKDQLCTTSMQLTNEPPQFEGLTLRIWPFMQDWYDNNVSKREKLAKPSRKQEDSNISNKNKFNVSVQRKVNSRKISGEEVESKLGTTKDKTISKNEPVAKKKKFYKRPLPPSEICKVTTQPIVEPKPVQQLRDKMLKLLYKNISVKDVDELGKTNSYDAAYETRDTYRTTVKVKPLNKVNEVELQTENFIEHDITSELPKTLVMKAAPETNNLQPSSRHSWAKGKWASEFIENIIRKIRNGVYYNHENTCVDRPLSIDLKEMSIQTVLTGKQHIQVNDEFKKERAFEFPENYYDVLPGFDERPPELEIKSLSMKEIYIRHCTTNVLVQFDVAQPSEPENLNPAIISSSLIPLEITENHTRILKCKTTIVNAVLPAELCSILPKLLKTIVGSNRLPSLQAITSYQNDSNLYTISELSRSESPDVFKYSLPTLIGLSAKVKKLLDGIYSYKMTAKKSNKIIKCRMNIRYCNMKEVLPILQSTQKLFALKVHPIDFICTKPNAIRKQVQSTSKNSCTALQLYTAPNHNILGSSINSSFNSKCSITNLLQQIWDQKISIRFKMSMPLGSNNIINVLMETDETACIGTTYVSISNLKADSLHKNFTNINERNESNVINGSSLKAIEYKKNIHEEKADRKETQGFLSHTKTRKRGFVKLYKKCKSTSNIWSERCSTSISKIINLDDFCQAMGSGKMLSSVFDGHVGKKIMSSVSEMNSWITDINQRQAMLVLLLTNKKDTPNLVRFRPILLQGIAVNRITRASELDMEIEVIERENFNRFSQYEGISYSPENVENPNNLLEELFWIAKTTASDYQKPFNESTEKLLKSLLEKRKKLNPSYLRVMARYVGLGLLKLPRTKLN